MLLWVIECKSAFGPKWAPVLGFLDIPGVHRVRAAAREAKQQMEIVNLYRGVKYRVAKYVRAVEVVSAGVAQ